ncbi:MAG: hypothetical protein IID61_02675 [SAR324 cluster bacterium]|nr:hypothetical protein [SAR324 cluster bacterium]
MAPRKAARQAVLGKDRRFRKISNHHSSEALERHGKRRLFEWGRRLELVAGKKLFVAQSEEEMHLVFDLAVFSRRLVESPAIERYRRTAGLQENSEEQAVLDAMCDARFAFLVVMERHPDAGLIARDILLDEDLWLMDESLEETAEEGTAVATRLFKPDEFHMTTGVLVPLDEPLLSEVERVFPQRERNPNLAAGKNPRLIECVYKAAITSGNMERVAFQ